MKNIVGCLMLIALISSCRKDKQEAQKPVAPAELLTRETWILQGHGFDDNGNDTLDAHENLIKDCEKDNTYQFNPDGTGAYADNALTCGPVYNNDFNWQLKNGNTELEIDFEPLFVLKLDDEQMVLNPDIPGLAVKYLLTYKH